MASCEVRHLGIIPDGTRRWARKNGSSYYDAYWLSMKLIVEILDRAFSMGVKIQSVYMLSTDNLKRSKPDLDALFAANERLFNELLPAFCAQWSCSVKIAGQIQLLPRSYVEALKPLVLGVTEKLAKKRKLNLLIAYNPWEEISHAIECAPTPLDFRQFLWVPDDLELVIRTASGQLISNFLPLQSGYAELYFVEKYWNDVSVDEIAKIINDFPHSGQRLLGR